MNSSYKIIFPLLISVFLLQCSENPVGNTTDDEVTPDIVINNLNETIVIAYSQVALIKDENLLIKFETVEEGRCPTGADCFWEGQATGGFLLIKPREGRAIAKPIIRPSVKPGTDEYCELADDALGYKLFLSALNPYPHIDDPIDTRDYIAKLRVEKISGICSRDEVCFTSTPPCTLQKDPVTVRRGELHEDILTITVTFGGGCGAHEFKLFMQPAFLESFPVQANLFLQHTDFGDPCDAIVSEDVSFNIRSIAELYKYMYGDYAEVILNVYGYFIDVPENKITLSYTPE